MKYMRFIYLFLFVFLSAGSLRAQVKTVPESQVKAAYVYNFLKFVSWPDDSFASPGANFVIGVTGNDIFANFLKEIVNGEKIGSCPIVVKDISDLQGVSSCNLVFAASTDPQKIKQLLALCDNKKILTVGDSESFLRAGGMISLNREGNKVIIEINLKAIRGSQLQVSSKLLSVAKMYNTHNK